jgi:hypothetical protein
VRIATTQQNGEKKRKKEGRRRRRRRNIFKIAERETMAAEDKNVITAMKIRDTHKNKKKS